LTVGSSVQKHRESRDVIGHVTRDHSIPHRSFPIGGLLEPKLYLERFLRYSMANEKQWLTCP